MKGLSEAKRKAAGTEGRPLSMYLVPGLLVAVLTVLILAVTVHQVLSRGAEAQAKRTMERAATLAGAALSVEVRNRIDQLSFLAGEPGLASWVARGMKPEDRQAEAARLATWLPGVLEVRLLPAGWQQLDKVDTGLPAPLGYAGVEMIRGVVASGKPAAAEIHQADIGKPYIALAVPLWRGEQTVGVLMAAYPHAAMRQLLESFDPLPGTLRLEQLANEQSFVLAKIGDDRVRSNGYQTLHVSGTIWQLSYAAAPQLAFGLDLLPFLGLVLLGLLPLVLIFWLQLRTLDRGLRHDLEGVVEQAQAFLEGRPAAPLHPRLQLTAQLQLQMGKLLREVRPRQGGASNGNGVLATATPRVEIPAEVFRAYDIRGRAEEQLSDEFAQRLGIALAGQVRKAGGGKLVVGRDVRHSSARLQQALTEGLIRGGCDVVDLGMVPTPLVYFAQRAQDAGGAVVVTGSHNPAEYNGFKIALGEQMLSGEELAALRPIMAAPPQPGDAPGERQSRDISADYLARVVADVQLLRPLKVVVDGGNGVAGPLMVKLLQQLGCEVFELFCEPDGDFPHHHPDPSRPENLSALMLEVQAREADIGLAFDGDGDRLGVVDSNGEQIWPDRLLMLLARDLLVRQPGADILYDVKCSRHLGRFVLAHGGRPIMNASGHSRMRARMQQTGAPLGGEFSGHFFISERWFGFDDALYAAVRLLEIIAADDRSSAEQFAELPSSPATPEYHLTLAEGENVTLMTLLAEQADFNDAELVSLDGLRVEFADGWGLVRPSNTTPSLVFRFEADNEVALSRIQGRIRDWLGRVVPGLTAPF